MSEYKIGDKAKWSARYSRTRPEAIKADAVGVVIEVETLRRMGPTAQIRVQFKDMPNPPWIHDFHFEPVNDGPPRETAAFLRQRLTEAREDIAEGANDPSVPTAQMLDLRWKAAKLAGAHELAVRAEQAGL